MSAKEPLDLLPIWGVYLFTVLLSLLAEEGGFRLGRLRNRRSRKPRSVPEKEGNVGAMMGASLALLAFLLVFLTGFASDRFETRRRLVVEEANAVGTTYLRAGYLEEPFRTEIRQLLREYVSARLEIAEWDTLDDGRIRSEEIHHQLWQRAETVAQENPDSEMVALFIESLNEVIDLHTKRVQAVMARVPPTMWWGIYFVALLTMSLVGYQNGLSGNRHFIAVLILVLIFSAVILLMVDLDRPREGFLRVGQQALLDLQQHLDAPTP